MRRWEAAGRDDILAWVGLIAVGDTRVYDLWIDPKTGDDVSRCPWVEQVPGTDRYVCRIHDLKPDQCRRYPQSRKHADETGCQGYGKMQKRPRTGNRVRVPLRGGGRKRHEESAVQSDR